MTQRKLIAYLGVSLDGYIATSDESVKWLETVPSSGDNGYGEFYASIDTILMGHSTYDWIMRHVSEFPYPDKVNIVFSHSQQSDSNDVTFVNNAVEDFVTKLKNDKGDDIWICGGGKLFSDLLKMGLVDEIRLNIAPIILGQGISLYQDLVKPSQLTLLDMHRHNQFVELIYSVN